MATFFGKIMGVQMIVNNLSSGLPNDDEMVVADKHLQWTYIALSAREETFQFLMFVINILLVWLFRLG